MFQIIVCYFVVYSNCYIFSGEFTYRFDKARRKNQLGTLLIEDGKIIMPWLLRDFANKTTITQHSEILQNIKLIVEIRTNEHI